MSITPPKPSSLAKMIASAMTDDFLDLARRLRDVHNLAPDDFRSVIKMAGVGKRKGYALLQIDRCFGALTFDRDRLLAIGWSKAVVLARHIDQQNCEQLLSLAEEHTVHDLAVILSGGVAHPNQRVVLLYLAAEDYALFEQFALKYGASREGRGLAGKEQAVVTMMAELGKLTAPK